MQTSEIKFQKWHGLGNDFIILENTKATPELAIKLCDRNFSIGADGIFSLDKSDSCDIKWHFYNSDGTSAQMCGNAIRCCALYVKEKNILNKNKFSVETLAGTIIPEILENNEVRVDMGKPILDAKKIPVNSNSPQDFKVQNFEATAVSMGNPHCVIFTQDDGKKLALEMGKAIEFDPIFPQKTNVEFINIIDKNNIKMNVWERGCGITLACGTGACASVVAGILKGKLNDTVKVELQKGSLKIEYFGENVFMSGPATKVYEGKLII